MSHSGPSPTLTPYTFADDLAEDIADENEQRSAEEVLLFTIDNTADDKLSHFALRLALSGHVGIPREGEFDCLTEAEAISGPNPTQEERQQQESEKAHVHQGVRGHTYAQAEEDSS